MNLLRGFLRAHDFRHTQSILLVFLVLPLSWRRSNITTIWRGLRRGRPGICLPLDRDAAAACERACQAERLVHACVYAGTGERERARVARLYELSFLLSLSPPHKTAGDWRRVHVGGTFARCGLAETHRVFVSLLLLLFLGFLPKMRACWQAMSNSSRSHTSADDMRVTLRRRARGLMTQKWSRQAGTHLVAHTKSALRLGASARD